MLKCKTANPIYRFRGTLQTDTSTDDNPAESFTTTVADMPLNVVPIGGQETYRGRQLEANVDYVIETPYRSGVDPKQRIKMTSGIYNGQLLNIERVHRLHQDGSRPTLELYCTELDT